MMVGSVALHYAHRTTLILLNDPSTLTPPLTGGWPVWPPIARVQRGPSKAARCASTGGQQATLPILPLTDVPFPWLSFTTSFP